MARTLYMETTKIPPMKTIGEIQAFLIEAGATGVNIEADPATKQPTAIAFRAPVNGQEIPFLLPARMEPVFKHIQKKRSVNYRERGAEADREQASRVAWRQILRWVQAQFALIEVGMAELSEVFMPYIQIDINRTLFQELKEKKFKGLLPEGTRE